MKKTAILALLISVITGQYFAAASDSPTTDVLFSWKPGQSDLSKFTLTFPNKWRVVDDGVIYKNDDWGFASATINPGMDDYRIDADVSVGTKASKESDLVNPGKDNGPGLIFRKSGDKAALFYLAQPCGGWAAVARYTEPRFSGKDTAYGLDKDTEKGIHHLTALVKGNRANCYVDGALACILDLTGYEKGDVGLSVCFGGKFTSFTVSKLPADAKLADSRPVRPLLRDGKIYQPKCHWTKTVEHNMGILNEAMAEGSYGVPGQEKMPHYTYRCVRWMKKDTTPFYAYPAFHHTILMTSLLNYYEYKKDAKYLDEAVRLADWEIDHSTPATDKLPFLPYSTTFNGKMGGNVDGDTVMLDKAGIMGRIYLRLHKMTGNAKFKTGAVHIAETLLKSQLPDGRWQCRVNNKTGAVKQDYVSNLIFNIELMDALFELTGEKRYEESSKKAFDWLMANPVKTYRWTGFYEDVDPGAESIGNWDAIDTARYLVAHRDRNPEYLRLAEDISDWIATSFTVAEHGKWPLVCEQSVCMPPMAGHTFHYALLLSDLHKATGKKYYEDAAISAANAAFDFSNEGFGASDWYSDVCSPIYLGLELVNSLGNYKLEAPR